MLISIAVLQSHSGRVIFARRPEKYHWIESVTTRQRISLQTSCSFLFCVLAFSKFITSVSDSYVSSVTLLNALLPLTRFASSIIKFSIFASYHSLRWVNIFCIIPEAGLSSQTWQPFIYKASAASSLGGAEEGRQTCLEGCVCVGPTCIDLLCV